MSESGNGKYRITTLIRLVLCVITLVLVLLGMFKVLDKSYTIPITSGLLIGITGWNAIEAVIEKRKRTAIMMFICFAILIILLAINFIKG